MEVKVEVKMDITPPTTFTFLLFYLFTFLPFYNFFFIFFISTCGARALLVFSVIPSTRKVAVPRMSAAEAPILKVYLFHFFPFPFGRFDAAATTCAASHGQLTKRPAFTFGCLFYTPSGTLERHP